MQNSRINNPKISRHTPKKSLGQHFLVDTKVLENILAVADLRQDDLVVEIGPGKGILTHKLLEKTKKVIAVEKDEILARELNGRFQKFIDNDKLNIIADDILEINFPEILEKEKATRYKVVANIPYYITGKIIRLLFETRYVPELIVLLVQKEVAERICADVGRMSKLATIVRYYGTPEIITIVHKSSFNPSPKVDSAIIKIVPRKYGEIKHSEHEKDLFRIIRIGFASPRKTLANNLSVGLCLPKESVKKILKRCNIDETVRAQELNVGDWEIIRRNI
ncbi:MAG: 16S rRNA (adenine(1518)-N(6)/adenine(1519)-N(6))-dimethyltransferase RsmA [Patescibacteria group bacterium]|nr:16S rRNA (adenine(1518)-N(6)/adenine(1519)-N(6))-dimethyltransferase RsmA [Patescibacteria group bacterium]